ncbi:hypothetical protein TSUD_182030 [Trifolium subterraneum]|uniref:Reverse transcriptase domain-containing protein n=1 Tax=Trifolium subterraneum TaxID=3900 RepID=A0A2Z6PHY2_TRISU|nr:hypothetical protein TSUD_182030 [Trifolium subterraneum]
MADVPPTTIEEAIRLLTSNQSSLHSQQTRMASQIDEILHKLAALDPATASASATSPPPPSPPPFPRPHRMKLDVPRFNGTDALGWIFKINQFFDYHDTPEAERLTVASFYMEGPALGWFQWMSNNGQLTSWSALLYALEARFAPSQYNDPKGALFKLTQRSTVNDYLSEFETLANRITGLAPSFLLSCFISGLNSDVRREVQALQPLTLIQAAALARLQEEKLNDHRRAVRGKGILASTPSPTKITPPLLQSSSKPIFKRLSPTEMTLRREKGLCFNCDEKFSPGHKCASKFFIMIAEEDVASDESYGLEALLDPPQPDPEPDPDTTQAQISFHALSGHLAPETLRLIGRIAAHNLVILINGGSTDNFIQERLVKSLGLQTQPTQALRVMVGNGNIIECHQVCTQIPIHIQNQVFTVDLHVLPLSGADVVFGVQWMKSLGPILTDYNDLTMKFIQAGKIIELKGNYDSGLSLISAQQVKRLMHTDGASEFFHIQLLSPEFPSLQNPDPHIQPILQKFSKLFQKPTTLPPPRTTNHAIHLLPNSQPVNVRPYRYPYFQKYEIEKQVTEMLSNGIIRPSTSPFSSPVLLVKKKDGTWRFCVDYRALNAITVKDRFPIPTIDELLDELAGATWFSKLDLLQGYHQILMNEADVEKTAFRTHQGHYEFRVMPFGLCSAPSSFQATMNTMFQPFLRKFIIVFFDDILIYSTTLEDHLHHLDQTLQILQEGQFFLKQSKCVFAQRQIEYLGHIVSTKGVEPIQAKVQAIQQWLVPRSVKALRGFLGLTGFYRRFIQGYATIATPLTQLLKKDQFGWNQEAQLAFETLKMAITQAPILVLPNFSLPFTVETDASGVGMGAVLSQQNHPIAFFSKPFCPILLRSSTYVRELFAITAAVKKWRQYLLGHQFIILTDHRSLKELMSQVIQTPEQQLYLARLIGYDYTIQYQSGKSNTVADALSRVPEFTGAELLTLSVPSFTFLRTLKQELQANESFVTRKQEIELSPADHVDFKVVQDLIFHRGRIWLPQGLAFTQVLLEEFHKTPIGGHLGVSKTVARLSENFTWSGLRQDVQQFVAACIDCQHSKYETCKAAGLLCPLPIPHSPWEDLSLDFIVGLPPYLGNTTILVVVDRFSKGIHLGMLQPHYTAYKVASLFMEIVGKLHVHSGTGKTPFEVTYGKPPPNIPQYLTGSSAVDAVDALLSNREEMLITLRKKLAKAQETMKSAADYHRREVQYQVNDWVMVKLRPHKQKTATGAPYSKLGKRYYGPFQIIERIGPVAYKLKLPEESRIHPVFHCSILKPFHGEVEQLNTPIIIPDQERIPDLPLAIISTRHGIEPECRLEVLVQWEGLSPDDTTWEDWEHLKSKYHLEDKVFLEGVKDVIAQDKEGPTVTEERPKRKITPPKHLEEYDTTIRRGQNKPSI